MRTPFASRRATVTKTALAAAALAVSAALLAPTVAVAAPLAVASEAVAVPLAAASGPAAAADSTAVAAATSSTACTVTEATLTWGFKESFRSYISGSIAKGTWETFGGATYTTPVFGWSGGTGSYDPSTSTGQIAFPGGIHFTGHNGLLDSTVSNLTLAVTGPATAQLLVDLSGVSMESAMAGDNTVDTVTQVPLVDVDLAAAAVTDADGTLTIAATDAPTAITAAGFEAFGNYETGTPFDAVTVSVTATCPEPEPTPEPSATVAETLAADDASSTGESDAGASVWIWGLLGGLAVAAIAVVVSTVVSRRRKADAAIARAATAGAEAPDDTTAT